eukprot:CAMPEP_0202027378 /NCGR_PEP_ID=MMETSP0905-20130828/61323_1 /ASSEMBLY_ACC=CAM_ASM_000554 /TAXON_ID=420261 /ORGANISM="Thalassiosira antarctica, Strain CCMP982" /LENGTH=291 /DNA_ID=CAMNT_0048590861 /DNA_START=150 /DNA_END=1022 /DNA_ORIENTATION=+
MNGVIVNEERDLYPLVSDSKTSLVNTAIEGERIEDNVVAGSTKGENEIPKVIHIVGRKWLTENDSWKKLNPEYNVEFYNDQRCLELVKEYYPHFEFVYSHLKSVRRYDFVRYLIVYHYGGIYADSDITCKEPINNWELRNETTFFTGMECIGCNYIGIQTIQWTFGATKGHPILDHVIKNVVSNSFKAPSFFERFGKLNKIIHMTGPAAFSDGITAYLIEKGTCEPKVGSFKNTKGFVTCSSIDPFGYTSGVQVFPWYRWGAAKNGDMPDRPPNIGPNDGKFIKHGYKGSW